jgi:2-oxoglutarate ferredoxin oxidoreductase subunit alpha
MTSLTKEATVPLGVKPRDAERSKNFFALGLVSWMYTRPIEPTLEWIDDRFARTTWSASATVRRSWPGSTSARPPRSSPPLHRQARRTCRRASTPTSTATLALAWGLVAAAQLAKLPLTLGSYPITPASDILHELSKHKNFGVRTVQAEDEIAAAALASAPRSPVTSASPPPPVRVSR